MHRPGERVPDRKRIGLAPFFLRKIYVVVEKNMRKHNRKPPSGIIELDEDLLLGFRMDGFEGRNVCHSRRALPKDG